MLVIVAVLLPTVVLADSIAPASFSADLDVGESVTITKTVTVTEEAGTSAPVDVFFLADATGSMGSYINAVKASASSILSSTAGLGDVAFGVGEYRDVGDYPYGSYRLNTDLTTDQATAQAGINKWSASGGADWAEADLFALKKVADDTSWRTGSTRILVWFGDAPGHDPSSGVTEASATTALQNKNIVVQAINVASYGGGLDAYGQATRITTATGGTYYSGIDSGSIVATIEAAIKDVIDKYNTVSLELSEVPAGVDVSVAPVAYTGSYNRSVERTFDFDVTFTGVTAGTYDFNIYGLVDGGRVATEADHIVVGSTIPEPGTLLLLSLGLLGLGGVSRKIRR